MRKGEIRYLVILCLLFVAVILFEIYRPKPIDWSPTLSNKDKIPYGTYVLYSVMDELFPEQEIIETREPVYNFLENDTSLLAHYIFIASQLNFDSNDINRLLDFVSTGNSVFISAQYMYSLWPLLDSLHVQVRDTMTWTTHDSTMIFTNPRLNTQPYCFRKLPGGGFFEADSLANVTVLGKNGLGGANFIKASHGEGVFYLHTVPLAFSNYYVLNDSTSDYAFKALSYLPPDRPVVWDEYANQGRKDEKSMMRVIMAQPAMRWAYYIIIFGMLLFVIFEGKRRQRVIPVIRPLRNTTLDFLNVVSRLYFQKQDHKGIAHKKIIFFLEQVRSQYHLPTNRLDDEFVETLSQKSGYPLDKTKYLIWKISQTEKQNSLVVDDLMKLNDEIENFYHHAV